MSEISTCGPRICKFFIPRKKRSCKFQAAKGEEFCPEHLPRKESGDYVHRGKMRIPCPLDPKHTVFESKLESHLKKCNGRPDSDRPYYHLDVNVSKDEEPQRLSLADVELNEIISLIEKVEVLYNQYVSIPESIEEHSVLKSVICNPEFKSSSKHRRQEASLLGNMEKQGWIADGTIYAEFGAGRGRLATYLIQATKDQPSSHILLIDRDHARNKCENKYKYEAKGASIDRIRIDIKDFCPERHHKLISNSKPIVAYSKHLCGSATDLTLTCLARMSADDKGDGQKRLKLENSCTDRVQGIQIALCCHHRCTWKEYCGKEFWRLAGLNTRDFVLVRCLTSWATCAFKTRKDNSRIVNPSTDAIDYDEHSDEEQPLEDDGKKDRYEGMNREVIGYKCKRLLDYGRAHFLDSIGFKSQLLTYIHSDVTPENVMLSAVWKSDAKKI